MTSAGWSSHSTLVYTSGLRLLTQHLRNIFTHWVLYLRWWVNSLKGSVVNRGLSLQIKGHFLVSLRRTTKNVLTKEPFLSWSVGQLFCWSVVLLVSCSVGQLASWPVRQLFCWSVVQLANWSVGQLVSLPVGQFVSCSVGQLFSWSVGQLVSCSVGQLFCWSVGQLVSCSVIQLFCWSVVLLVTCSVG